MVRGRAAMLLGLLGACNGNQGWGDPDGAAVAAPDAGVIADGIGAGPAADDAVGSTAADAGEAGAADATDAAGVAATDARPPLDPQAGFNPSPASPDPLAPGLCEGRWCWSNPLPHGNRIVKMWGRDGQVWAAGHGGTVLRWDGTRWMRAATGSWAELTDVWGTPDGHVFTVGDGEILHFDGKGWRDEAPPSSPATRPSYRSVSGTALDDVWVAGHFGVLLHRSATGFARATGAPFRSAADGFTYVQALARDNVFVGGESEILRFDGQSWRQTRFSEPVEGVFRTVWGTGPDNLWASGASRAWRWTGTEWTRVPPTEPTFSYTGPISGSAPSFIGTSPTDMWGADGKIWRLQGDRWGALPQPGGNGGYGGASAGWALAPNDVFFAGPGGALHRWDGTKLDTLSSGHYGALTGVWSGGGAVVVAGEIPLHRGPNGWVRTPVRLMPTAWTPKAVWGASATQVWAVTAAGGVLLRFSGDAWTNEPNLPAGTGIMLAITGTSASDVWAIGTGGRTLHFDGTSWQAGTSAITTSDPRALCAAGSELWSVGNLGAQRWTRDTGWMAVPVPRNFGPNAVWCSGPGDVWAVGGYAQVYRWDGKVWKVEAKLVDIGAPDLHAVGGTGPRDVWVVGQRGFMAHFDGTRWQRVGGVGGDLNGLFFDRDGSGWAVGANGAILRLRP